MIVDLFAGPGGWSEGLRLLGLEDVGLEWDQDACATRHAAGHATIRGDVFTADPYQVAPGGAVGLIASPPCPLFSIAGSGVGSSYLGDMAGFAAAAFADGWRHNERAVAALADTIHDGADDHTVLPGFASDGRVKAEQQAREMLCAVVPTVWVAALRPRWVCFEQVPTVLPLWEACADAMRGGGYSVWCGILNAADYGVPQTRRRAFLVASLDRDVAAPPATHTEDGGERLARWVSMADALGWSSGRVGFPRLDDRGDSPDGYRVRDWRDVGEPAQAVMEKVRSWQLQPGTYATKDYGNRRLYTLDEPAPTVAFGNDSAAWAWTSLDPTEAEAVRLSVADALALQSFRPDYPVQGVQSSRFRQIGNAVPPLLAAHVVAAATGLPAPGAS